MLNILFLLRRQADNLRAVFIIIIIYLFIVLYYVYHLHIICGVQSYKFMINTAETAAVPQSTHALKMGALMSAQTIQEMK